MSVNSSNLNPSNGVSVEENIESKIELTSEQAKVELVAQPKVEHAAAEQARLEQAIDLTKGEPIKAPGEMKALVTGTTAPGILMPFDKLNQALTENKKQSLLEAIKTVAENKPYKGVAVSMSTGVLSNGVFFITNPLFQKEALKHIENNTTAYASAIAAAGATEAVIMGPVNTIRIKVLSPENAKKSTLEIISEVVKSPNAVRDAYKGLSMNIARNTTYGVPYWVLYSAAMDYLENDKQGTFQGLVNSVYISGTLGSGLSAVSYPFDVLSRLQRSNHEGSPFHNMNAHQIAQKIITEEGISGFYTRGYKTVPPRMFISGAITGAAIFFADSLYRFVQTGGAQKIVDETFSQGQLDNQQQAALSKQLTEKIDHAIKSFMDVASSKEAIDQALEDGMMDIEQQAEIAKQLEGRLAAILSDTQCTIGEVLNQTFEQANIAIEDQAGLSEQLLGRFTDGIQAISSAVIKVFDESKVVDSEEEVEENKQPILAQMLDTSQKEIEIGAENSEMLTGRFANFFSSVWGMLTRTSEAQEATSLRERADSVSSISSSDDEVLAPTTPVEEKASNSEAAEKAEYDGVDEAFRQRSSFFGFEH